MSGINLDQVIQLITVGAIPILFAITLHEVAHGWAAKLCGDRTAEMLGRLSLNPLKHIDPVGTVAVPLVFAVMGGPLFGWAKPVPVGFNNLRHPKRDMVYVALAGPGANLVMALLWAFAIKAVVVLGLVESTSGQFLLRMSDFGIRINALLMALNLLPIPPLDGGRVLRGLVSESIGRQLDRIEPFGLIIIVLLLVTGVLWSLIQPLYGLVERLVLFVVGL